MRLSSVLLLVCVSVALAAPGKKRTKNKDDDWVMIPRDEPKLEQTPAAPEPAPVARIFQPERQPWPNPMIKHSDQPPKIEAVDPPYNPWEYPAFPSKKHAST